MEYLALLEVRTGSRLHFGLLELAEGQALRYGGLGMMVERPNLAIRLWSGAKHGRSSDEIIRRVAAVVQRRSALEMGTELSEVQVALLTPLRIHSGLGFGTQFACAVAVGLELLIKLRADQVAPSDSWQAVSQSMEFGQMRDVAWLANHSARGQRSSIGLHGFLRGGLVVDRGHELTPEKVLGETPTEAQCDELPARKIATSEVRLPEPWRVVLIIPSEGSRVSGRQESELLAAASVHSNPYRDRMMELAERCLSLTSGSSDFKDFTTSIDQYTELAGRLFENVQGGQYRSCAIQRAAELARNSGLAGVGQSSWGPTVFGFAPCEDAAAAIAGQIARQVPEAGWEVLVTVPSSTGATWRTN